MYRPFSTIWLSHQTCHSTSLVYPSWRKDKGPLIVEAINTRGDDAGWVQLPGDGVHVADIVDDADSDVNGFLSCDVHLRFSPPILCLSIDDWRRDCLPQRESAVPSTPGSKINLVGSGFKRGISFTFEPNLKEGTDYSLVVDNKNSITLTLVAGKKWASEPGMLLAKTVKIDGKGYRLGGSDGIHVANILADPVVAAGQDCYHETQSKVIAIKGQGFTNVGDTKVVIRPTLPNAYKILSVTEDTIRIQLIQGHSWLPSHITLKSKPNMKVPLQVTSIDTGAGLVTFPSPVAIGFIVSDTDVTDTSDNGKPPGAGVGNNADSPVDKSPVTGEDNDTTATASTNKNNTIVNSSYLILLQLTVIFGTLLNVILLVIILILLLNKRRGERQYEHTGILAVLTDLCGLTTTSSVNRHYGMCHI